MNSPASSPGSISRPENMKRKPIFYSVMLTKHERERLLQGVKNAISNLEENMEDLTDGSRMELDSLRRLRFRLEDCSAVY